MSAQHLINARVYANITAMRLPTDPAFTKALLSSITTLIFGAALVLITVFAAGPPAPVTVFQYPKAAPAPAAAPAVASAWTAPGCVMTACDGRIDK
jgi:hypothetical protein